jgi:hypothetical protein
MAIKSFLVWRPFKYVAGKQSCLHWNKLFVSGLLACPQSAAAASPALGQAHSSSYLPRGLKKGRASQKSGQQNSFAKRHLTLI